MGESDSCGKHWIMLVAGSKTWGDYRHQADVCHAYQIIHQNGIPDSQIVTMMYDNIANNTKNPFKGKIINKPNGCDVYNGVPKDYTGEDVTAENFLAALRGDRRAVRKNDPVKVITSGENDTIFIYLSGHGGSGFFCFPNSTLHATDLIATIKKMAYSKMVIYLESCCSGSVFTQLPSNFRVYAMTAADAIENSFACFYDKERKTFLSNKFSAIWMNYFKMADLDEATFDDAYRFLRILKCRTRCYWFGDKNIRQRPISEFFKNQGMFEDEWINLTDVTPTNEVPFMILRHQIESETDADKKEHLKRKHKALHQTRAKIEETIQAIKQHFPTDSVEDVMADRSASIDLDQFKTVAEHFRTTCFDWHDDQYKVALSHMHVFVQLCARGVEVDRIKEAITAVKHFDVSQ